MAGKDRDLRLEDGDVLFVPSSKGKAVAYRGLEATVSLLSGLAIYGRL
jgi:polysaccharide export outer membrane protein